MRRKIRDGLSWRTGSDSNRSSPCLCANKHFQSFPSYIPRRVAEMASECAIERCMFGEPHLQRDLTDPNAGTRWISQQREGAFEAFLFNKTAEGLSGLLEQKMDVAI